MRSRASRENFTSLAAMFFTPVRHPSESWDRVALGAPSMFYSAAREPRFRGDVRYWLMLSQ
jgi:hypothetical protein